MIQEPCNIKKRNEEGIGYIGARVVPASRRCIEARNGTALLQNAHRRGCNNGQSMAAFQAYGLLVESYGINQRRVRRSQSDEATENENKDEASTKRTNSDLQVVSMHVDAAVSSGTVAQMQNVGLNIHAAEFVPQSKSGNYAKVYQAVDSTGTADLTETPSPVGAVLSDVRGGGSQTDVREIAGDYDEDHHESDELWPERNGQMDTEV